jgi:hypothetical protein
MIARRSEPTPRAGIRQQAPTKTASSSYPNPGLERVDEWRARRVDVRGAERCYNIRCLASPVSALTGKDPTVCLAIEGLLAGSDRPARARMLRPMIYVLP